MNIQDKVCDTVTDNFRTSTVFKSHGIDFCCNGNITIEEVCKKKNVDPTKLMEELLNTETSRGADDNFSEWNTDFLIGYIVNNHHNYLRKVLPAIEQYTEKVAKVHGTHTPSLVRIHQLFVEVKNDLLPHLLEEENILFPLIKKIETGYLPTEEEKNMFKDIDSEHKKVGALLEEMNELANNYQPPEHACNTYRVSFSYLAELEKDTHKHIHFENNILFSRISI